MTAAGWHLQGVCCAAQSALQAQGAGEEQALDDEIAQLVAKVETHKMRRDFMRSLAERPLPFVHDVVCRLALDLATIRSEGSSSRLFAPTNARTHAHTRTRAHAHTRTRAHAHTRSRLSARMLGDTWASVRIVGEPVRGQFLYWVRQYMYWVRQFLYWVRQYWVRQFLYWVRRAVRIVHGLPCAYGVHGAAPHVSRSCLLLYSRPSALPPRL
jgi:hypothetical protein